MVAQLTLGHSLGSSSFLCDLVGSDLSIFAFVCMNYLAPKSYSLKVFGKNISFCLFFMIGFPACLAI